MPTPLPAQFVSEPLVHCAPPFEDSPAYWLGKLVAIAEMEKRNSLTKHQAVSELQTVIESMKNNQARVRQQAGRASCGA